MRARSCSCALHLFPCNRWEGKPGRHARGRARPRAAGAPRGVAGQQRALRLKARNREGPSAASPWLKQRASALQQVKGGAPVPGRGRRRRCARVRVVRRGVAIGRSWRCAPSSMLEFPSALSPAPACFTRGKCFAVICVRGAPEQAEAAGDRKLADRAASTQYRQGGWATTWAAARR